MTPSAQKIGNFIVLSLVITGIGITSNFLEARAQSGGNNTDPVVVNLQAQWDGNDFKDVEKEAQHAINNGNDNPEIYHFLARAQARRGNADGATKTLTTLIAKHPNYSPCYLTYARIFEGQGKTEEAKDFYRMYVDKSKGKIPRDPGLRLKLREMGLY